VTQQPRGSAPDLIGDFQRWLVRSGARSVSREVGGHLRSVLGRNEPSGDVWQSATSPDPPEAPECAWCPFCRAARLLRESGPGVSSQVAAASDVVARLAQEAMSVVDSALAGSGRPAGPGTGSRAGRATPGARAARDPDRDRSGSPSVQAGSAAGPGAGPGSTRDRAGAGSAWDEAEPASVWEQASSGLVPEPDAADGENEPEPTGPPGGPPHEPDDRG
jgi:hypothetical protein